VCPRSGCSAARIAAIPAEQDLAEGEAEVGVEDGVDDGVEEAVEVAQPDDDADQEVGVMAAVGAERPDKGEDEERQPAADERPGNDAERTRRLTLACLFALLGGSAFGRQSLRTAQVRRTYMADSAVELLLCRCHGVAVRVSGGGGGSGWEFQRRRRCGSRVDVL